METIYFVNLGCPRNLVDTEVMLGTVLEKGYNISQDISNADYFIINTCGFIEDSRIEALEMVEETMDNKKASAKVIVTGCMVAQHKYLFEKYFPSIHYYVGAGNVDEIIHALEDPSPGEIIHPPQSFLENAQTPRHISTPQHYAYLKIAEGCCKRCSYCIIPQIKGPLRSKDAKQVVQEFQKLLDQGISEIILVAQDLGDYGKDLNQKTSLTDLLKQLLAIDGDFWIRLMYVYPDEITDELIQLMQHDERICNYLDMPIQHINDTVLKNMRRATNKQQITSTIKKLRKNIPDIVIRTSLIVGFPGETEDQFKELMQFVEDNPLDHVGIFEYSPEEQTPASTMENQIDEETKEQRYYQLMEKQQEIVLQQNQKMIGKQLPVVIEGYHPESDLLMIGRYYGQCPDIDSQIIINDSTSVDTFGCHYLVEITDVAGYDLVGSVINKG